MQSLLVCHCQFKQGTVVDFTFGNNGVVIVRNEASAKSWINFHITKEVTLCTLRAAHIDQNHKLHNIWHHLRNSLLVIMLQSAIATNSTALALRLNAVAHY